MVFGLNDKGGNLSGKGLSILGVSFDDIKKYGGLGIGKADLSIIDEYNKALSKTKNQVTGILDPQAAYYKALNDGNGGLKKINSSTEKLIVNANGAAVSQESMSQALKATSLSSQAAAAGMKALSIAGMLAVLKRNIKHLRVKVFRCSLYYVKINLTEIVREFYNFI